VPGSPAACGGDASAQRASRPRFSQIEGPRSTSMNGGWQNATLLPGSKTLMPGVVGHATNLVENSALVTDRILRYAAIVGRENVIAGTDCGLGGRVRADLAWAKLRTLAEGARLPSKSLWP
jgi:methionine synthase II (cobalamin-independent)